MSKKQKIRILHGHVDAGLMRLKDEEISATRFSRDPMPIDCHRAVLLVLDDLHAGADTLVEIVGRIALENEQLKLEVARLEEACMQMGSDLVTAMDDPDHGDRLVYDDDHSTEA